LTVAAGRKRVSSVRRFFVPLGVVVSMIAAILSTAVPASALSTTLPEPDQFWPDCRAASDVMCVEFAELVSNAGTVTNISTESGDPEVAHRFRVFSRAGGGPPEGRSLAMNVDSGERPFGQHVPGIPDGLYRISIRTGGWDPTMTVINGLVQRHVVSGDPTAGFTVGVEVRPTSAAFGDSRVCSPVQWMCRPLLMVDRLVLVGIIREVDGPTSPVKGLSLMRGLYHSTNATMVATPRLDAATNSIYFNAAAPHWLLESYGNGNEINPGFYEVFVPKTYLEDVFGMSLDTLTLDSFVQRSSHSPLAPLSIVKSAGGVLVQFGVEHWSMNDPSVEFRPWPTIVMVDSAASRTATLTSQTSSGPIPTGTITFAPCTDGGCSAINEAAGISVPLVAGSGSATATIPQASLVTGAPNYRAYFSGDANYPEGARAYAVEIPDGAGPEPLRPTAVVAAMPKFTG
jgi:hypothetical protein